MVRSNPLRTRLGGGVLFLFTKLFMTIVLSYVMVLGNIQTKYFVQAILISTMSACGFILTHARIIFLYSF